jgi:hypothetical protein
MMQTSSYRMFLIHFFITPTERKFVCVCLLSFIPCKKRGGDSSLIRQSGNSLKGEISGEERLIDNI